jgi:hypothetical protein
MLQYAVHGPRGAFHSSYETYKGRSRDIPYRYDRLEDAIRVAGDLANGHGVEVTIVRLEPVITVCPAR